jgi:hypothetical protein
MPQELEERRKAILGELNGSSAQRKIAAGR